MFFETAKLLENKGHKVIFFSMKHPENLPCAYEKYFVENIDYDNIRITSMPGISLKLLYSFEAKRKIERLIEKEKPDIAHLHNIYHHISPSIIHGIKKYKIPIIETLHDYKMVCPSYAMRYNEKPCEDCGGGRYYRCFLKKCSKNSRFKSLLNTAEMYLHHKILRIYEAADIFISPSKFLKMKLYEMGFRRKIVHLPNFAMLNGFAPQYDPQEKTIVYFGRLSPEKGLVTLLEAVKDMADINLKIIGDGPEREILKSKVKNEKLVNVKLLGYKTGEDLRREIQKAMFVALPSECYENNPCSVIESFALGKAVVGSRIGGIPELVKDNITGLTFETGNAEDLRLKIKYMLENPDRVIEMGKKARIFVEKELSADEHYDRLMEIYHKALKGERG